jgi:hypothetical protein
MPRKVGHVIHDILEAIDRVEEVTRSKTLSDFEKQLAVALTRATGDRNHFRSEPRNSQRFDRNETGNSLGTGTGHRQRFTA